GCMRSRAGAEQLSEELRRSNSSGVRLDVLSDDVLLARLREVLARSRRVEADLVAHIAEVDARRLYLREACPSMHVYATERLHLTDAEAYLRTTVARVSRRFPVALAMLADGRLHLSAIAKLAPHLRDDGAEALLARAAHRSKREIELLLAELAPKPDVPSLVRRLPGPASPANPSQLGPDGVIPAGMPRELAERGSKPGSPSSPCPLAAPSRPAAVVSIAPARYKVQFTAGAELHDKIARAQALLRRQVPDGDLGAIVDRAMSLLLRELERARFAATAAPRKTTLDTDAAPSSRHIPAPVQRAVWERDGGQCTFHNRQGQRCPARERLEFHHVIPFGQGGDHSVTNIRLACAGHKAYQAELDYGAAFIARRRAGSDITHPRPRPEHAT
ncbi:MAG TPA: HNH endonuclease, partial [Kofleriaceae bacterium]|nr:HNH endonuclease [Kofleriaceae bacterium]